MLINKANLDTIFLNLKTAFHKSWEEAPVNWPKIAMRVESSSTRNEYKWLSEFPRMRKWIGDKVIKSLEGFSYTILNDDWEATIEVDRNDIEDDNLGIYGPQARMAGYAARQLADEIVFALVNGGFKNKCYDGKTFFATNHPVGNKNVSNKGTKALSVETFEQAQASFGAARTAMRKFLDDEGRPLGIMPRVLLVPPALEDTARGLMMVERLEDGKPNIYKGAAEVVVDARLTSDTAWFLLDTTQPVKPLIYQERKAPIFVEQTDMASDSVFLRKKYRYGVECRGAGGYGFWQMAYGSTGTA